MNSVISPDHPRERLLFYLAEVEIDEVLRGAVSRLVDRLASSGEWLLGSPQFISTREDPQHLAPGDLPVETTGGYLEIYTALPPWALPREWDLRHYQEVSTLVSALRDFSGQHGVAIELELDGKYVGSVKQGEMDRTLSEGLLGEWRRALGV
jgi:hypothetical protein